MFVNQAYEVEVAGKGGAAGPVMPATITNIVVAAVAALLLTSCPGAARLSPEEERFFQLPEAERHSTFARLTLEKQIELHLAAVTKIHPSDISFASQIACECSRVLQPVLEHIRSEATDGRTEAICLIVSEMIGSCRCSFSIDQKREIEQAIANKVSMMKFEPFKSRCARVSDRAHAQ